MSFTVAAEAYDRFMGRYSRELAPAFVAFAGVGPGARVVDVGCGPGALTALLAQRGAVVAAADPSASFVAACAERVPEADVREAPAEALPWADGAFDAALAQLVVTFMADAVAGVREMRRVVAPGGTVATCMWDLRGGMTMLRLFWEAALEVDPAAPAETGGRRRYGTAEELRALWTAAGIPDHDVQALDVEAAYADFDDWWSPFTGGVGPAGSYCMSLEPAAREAVREACRRRIDATGGFTMPARAWAIRGRVA